MEEKELRTKAFDYAESVCSGGFPIEYTREQVVKHTANDFIQGYNAALSERDKFAMEFAEYMDKEGFTYSSSFGYCLSENKKYLDNDGFPIEHSLKQLLDLYKQSLTSKPQEK